MQSQYRRRSDKFFQLEITNLRSGGTDVDIELVEILSDCHNGELSEAEFVERAERLLKVISELQLEMEFKPSEGDEMTNDLRLLYSAMAFQRSFVYRDYLSYEYPGYGTMRGFYAERQERRRILAGTDDDASNESEEVDINDSSVSTFYPPSPIVPKEITPEEIENSVRKAEFAPFIVFHDSDANPYKDQDDDNIIIFIHLISKRFPMYRCLLLYYSKYLKDLNPDDGTDSSTYYERICEREWEDSGAKPLSFTVEHFAEYFYRDCKLMAYRDPRMFSYLLSWLIEEFPKCTVNQEKFIRLVCEAVHPDDITMLALDIMLKNTNVLLDLATPKRSSMPKAVGKWFQKSFEWSPHAQRSFWKLIGFCVAGGQLELLLGLLPMTLTMTQHSTALGALFERLRTCEPSESILAKLFERKWYGATSKLFMSLVFTWSNIQ